MTGLRHAKAASCYANAVWRHEGGRRLKLRPFTDTLTRFSNTLFAKATRLSSFRSRVWSWIPSASLKTIRRRWPRAAWASCILRRHDGSALRADLTQKAALVRDYYEPHHRRLEECVFQHLRAFGRAIIIDCHSFPSVPLPYELVQDAQRPEVCIGADPVHTPDWLSAALVSAFERQRYSVTRDPLLPALSFRRVSLGFGPGSLGDD